MAVVLLLGARTIDNEDVGYHLAFGDAFLDTGRIVDHSPFLYTVQYTEPGRPLKTPGPGGWYDADGKFQFVSANWLTQAAMSAVNRAGGGVGLSILQIALVAVMFGLLLLILHELGLPPLWMAATVVLLGLVSYERLVLRPELFTYVLLAAQLYVLLRATHGAKELRIADCGLRIAGNGKEPALPLQSEIRNPSLRTPVGAKSAILPWRSVALLCVLEVLLVNVHSYFLLGLIPVGAMLGDGIVRMMYFRWHSPRDVAAAADARRRSVRLGVALAAMTACGFVNPWTWRMVLLPFQTLWYFKVNHITDAGSTHPLSSIGEFYPPLSAAYFYAKATWAFIAVLAVAAVGLLAALLHRRWGHAALIVLMVMVSMSMRRNIAVASLLLIGPALAAIHDLLGPRLPKRFAPKLAVGGGCVVAVVSALLIWSVVTDAFHFNERRPSRFGLGYSPLKMPIDACGWINEHKPVGRVWCDVDVSSNLYYFLRPHRDLPILTNSWAYQPKVIEDLIHACENAALFDLEARKYGVQIVVLRAGKGTSPLMKRLGAGDAWSPVFIDSMHVVFLRKDGPNAALAAKSAITPESLDAPARLEPLLAEFAKQDPRPEFSTDLGALTLLRLGWTDPAIQAVRQALKISPDYVDALNLLGMMSALRANMRLEAKQYYDARTDLQAAADAFTKLLAIRKDSQASKTFALPNGNWTRFSTGRCPR